MRRPLAPLRNGWLRPASGQRYQVKNAISASRMITVRISRTRQSPLTRPRPDRAPRDRASRPCPRCASAPLGLRFRAAESAALPALVEEPDAAARARVPRALVVVELEAEPRPVRTREAPVGGIDAWRRIHEVLDPGVREVVEVLEHLVVRRRDREVEVR